MARTWTIGSSPELDLVVKNQVVSGRHCRLTSVEGGYLLEDLGSTNGTFVNGTRINGGVLVTRGDVVTLGLSQPLPWPTDASPAPPARVLSIGREADNDFVVNLAAVSGHHARATWNGVPGEALIEDIGSANGTAVGASDRKVAKALIRAGDTVFLGSHPIAASEILARLERGPLPILSVGDFPLVIGRNPECGHVLDFPAVSGRHARLSRTPNGFLIEDLGSSNGTFVNGNRIIAPTSLIPGDMIGLGSYSLILGKEPPPPEFTGEALKPASGLTGDAPRTATPGLSELLSGPAPESVPTQTPTPPPPPVPLFSGDVFLNELKGLGKPAWRMGALLIQAPVVALLIVAALKRSEAGAGAVTPGEGVAAPAFWMGVAALWFGISNALIGCPARDRRSLGLDRHAARLVGLAMLCLFQTFIAWGIAGFGSGLVANAPASIFLLVLTALVGLAFGLAMVLVIPGRAIAWLVVPLILIPMVVLGGETLVFSSLPPWAKTAAGFVPTRWAFEGLLLLETEGRPGPEATSADIAERFFPAESDRMGVPADAIALGAMLLGLAAAGAFISTGPRPSSA